MKPAYISQDRLAQKSVELILNYQDESGSYVASPTFLQYRYAWLRDGAFCALAMHVSGESESARKFNSWVANTVLKHGALFKEASVSLSQGNGVLPEKSPPTRFHLDGSVESDHHEVWPNYQLDGYGTWLAIVSQIEPNPQGIILDAIKIIADFLLVAWSHPCYDCWEEGGDMVHGSTLLAVAGGLKAAANICGEPKYRVAYEKVIETIERDFVLDGHFIKNRGDSRIDSSLAWSALPHGAYALDHPIVLKTLKEIQRHLQSADGGVKRYLGDTYYGGGDWVLLEGLVAWNKAANGANEAWLRSRNWFAATADENHLLPEQVLDYVQVPEMVTPWEERWGKVAHPLLWSHAMYLLMLHEGAKQEWI